MTVMTTQATDAEHGEEIVLVEGHQLEISRSSSALEKAQAAFDKFIDSPKKASTAAAAAAAKSVTAGGQDDAERRSDKNVVEEKKDEGDAPAGAANDAQSEIDTERDFDTNPTELYTKIQKKEWDNTVQRAKAMPDEARIWVSRKEKDGRLRWRLLPIHAAIIFKAPEKVVEALLAAYPKGAECKDDQGMLPLHLAFRNGSTEAIVNLLLVSFPQSVDVKDRKGRIPLVLAQASTSPNRTAFLKALERGPTYFASAAAATERAAATAEQRAIYDTKLFQERQKHQYHAQTLQAQHEAENRDLKLQVEALKKELAKTQETSQVLVDHVNSLEAQLASRSDTERFLATKIANLDSTLKTATKTKEEIESTLRTENYALTKERNDLKDKLATTEEKLASTKSKLSKSLDLYETREKEWDEAETKMLSQIKSLEMDWASTQANCAILEAQLKKKMNTEHALASQVSALAGKLAEAAVEARDQTKSSQKRINAMEAERKLLRNSVQDLTKRLSMVATVLDQMTSQQQTIIDEAKEQEHRMVAAQKKHSEIVADVVKQEKLFIQAKKERRQILSLLELQEKQEKRSEEDRLSIVNAIALQGDHMEGTKSERDRMVNKVESLGNEIQGMMSTVLKGIPKEIENEEAMVDRMVRVCNTGPIEEESTDANMDEEKTATDAETKASATSKPESDANSTSTPTPTRRFARSEKSVAQVIDDAIEADKKAMEVAESSSNSEEKSATDEAGQDKKPGDVPEEDKSVDEPEDKSAVDTSEEQEAADVATDDDQASGEATPAGSADEKGVGGTVAEEGEEGDDDDIHNSPSGLEPEGDKSEVVDGDTEAASVTGQQQEEQPSEDDVVSEDKSAVEKPPMNPIDRVEAARKDED